MRRVIGLAASGLGTFLIVLALLTRIVVVNEAVKFPLNESDITTLVASNASYFSPAVLAEKTGVTLEDTLTIEGDNAAGTADRAVWNEFSYVYDVTDHNAVQYSTNRVAFDRRTGQVINCCGSAIGLRSDVNMSGLYYLWPLNSQKKTYQVFDATLLKPEPYTYAGTAVINGEPTYKYVETVSPTQSGTQTLPGSLVGQPAQGTVTLPEYYQVTTTEYVDPTTGAPVEGVSQQHLYLESAGQPVLDLLNATFSTTPASVAAAVKTAKHYDGEISLVSVILPVVLGLAGLVLLVLGVLLALLGRTEDYYEYEEEDYPTGQVTA
jgi:Porin PorA